MKIESIKYVLWVQDMERAFSFYHDTMGLAVWSESATWTELKHNGTTIALRAGGGGTDTPTGLCIQVDEIYSACVAIRQAGGEVVVAPHVRAGESILLARVTDSEGNEFALTSQIG